MDNLFKKQLQLSKRIRKNFNDYKDTMLKMNRQELFDHAAEITAHQITYCHMIHVSQYDEHSLDYLLKFANPLQVVTDHFNQDMSVDLDAIINKLCDTQDLLQDYEHMPVKNKNRKEPER